MDKTKFAVAGYEKIAQKYAKLYFNDTSDLGFFNKFLTYLPPKGKILDIGCGPGTFTQHLFKNGFKVEGIDLSTTMLKIARGKLPQVKFKLMDMRQLDYTVNSFDGIFAAYSLIHIASNEIPATLKGFYGVLKSNGILGLINQKGEADKILAAPLKKGEKMFFNFFTKKRLEKFLTDAGFKLEYQKEAVLNDEENSLSDRVIYTIARKWNLIQRNN